MKYKSVSFEKLNELLKGNRIKLSATVFKKRDDGSKLILDRFRFSGSTELLTRLKKIQRFFGAGLFLIVK